MSTRLQLSLFSSLGNERVISTVVGDSEAEQTEAIIKLKEKYEQSNGSISDEDFNKLITKETYEKNSVRSDSGSSSDARTTA